MPTTSRSSPTTTSAVKEKRRPPFTTFATRLIKTTRSVYGDFSFSDPPSRPRRSRRSLPPFAPSSRGPRAAALGLTGGVAIRNPIHSRGHHQQELQCDRCTCFHRGQRPRKKYLFP